MHSAIRYTPEVGRKFEADGTARLFPGNTIICPIDHDSALGRAATLFEAAIRQQPWGYKWALLPPDSFHMTVMELLCDQVRAPERWSSELTLDADLRDTDALFLERVPPLPTPERLAMRVSHIDSRRGLLIMLEPAEPATADALHAYREAVARATGVRAPDHNSYRFHMSVAYRLIELEAAETAALRSLCDAWEQPLRAAAERIELRAPELCFFDDMLRFVPASKRHMLRSRAG